MPLVPNILEHTIFFTLNQGPAPALDMFSAIGFRVVVAAIRLGVFDALDKSTHSTKSLAAELGIDPEGTRLLLESLEALGYFRRQGDQYANTAMTKKWLVSSSPTNFAPWFLFWNTMLTDMMTNLEESITTGKTPQNLYQWIEHQPETSAYFQQAMTAMARFGGDEIIGKLKLPSGPTQLLDIGGGHAMYSIALCEKYPEVIATVLDSPQALETARQNIKAMGMEQRIALKEGNFLEADYGTGLYDMAFVFNIVHGLNPELNQTLMRKTAQSLKPGGQIVIVEELAGPIPTPMGRATTRLLGLSFFHLIDGKTYTFEELSDWLRHTGYNQPQKHGLLKAPGAYVIVAAKA